MHTPHLTSSRPVTAPPDVKKFVMHTHEYYEIYCFVSGDADYYVEGTVYPLQPGDVLLMKSAEAHSLLIKSPAPYERVVIHFSADALAAEPEVLSQLRQFLDQRPLGKQNRYPAALFPNTNWRYYMEQIHQTKNFTLRQAYLTVLVWELCQAHTADDHLPTSGMIPQLLDYINTHLTQPLSLEQLCGEFYVSKAQLNRRFKKATGSTVWEYILTKRLLLARSLLQKGLPPAVVCNDSGFRDYCAFFRAYKKMFGVSPRKDLR